MMRHSHSDITVLLDASGSMGSIKVPTLKGLNAFIASQKASPGTATLSLIAFDSIAFDSNDHQMRYRALFDACSLDSVKAISDEDQPGGTTPLLDAMQRVITETGARLAALADTERPEHVVMVIITDGQENASLSATKRDIAAMVAHQRDVYKWQFIYLGANQDAISEAQSYGIPRGSASTYTMSDAGIGGAYRSVGNLVSSARTGATVTFSQDDRDKMSH